MLGLHKLAGRIRDHRRKVALFGHLAPVVPPESGMFDGTPTYEDYKQNATKAMTLYVDLAGLKPGEKVLDVGSGIGRKCLYLTDYLASKGTYDGIEIVKAGVDWCTKRITKNYPSFRFHHAHVYNQFYNPSGTVPASEFRFPFADNTFDLVTMFSVFTHMLPRDVEHYLNETSRVLRPGGRSLLTWFLLNDESKTRIDQGKAAFPLIHHIDANCRTADPANPEGVVAYEESRVRGWYQQSGLVIREPIRFGSWSSRPAQYFQDMVLAEKPAATPL